MRIFVSYSRQDNSDDVLWRIQQQIASLGTPYVDDLQDHRGRDRLAMVEAALESAHLFVAVMSPAYLKTAWTRREFECALRRDIPMLGLLSDGTVINPSSAEWRLLRSRYPAAQLGHEVCGLTPAPDDQGSSSRPVEVE
jgi:hypothetical protein